MPASASVGGRDAGGCFAPAFVPGSPAALRLADRLGLRLHQDIELAFGAGEALARLKPPGGRR